MLLDRHVERQREDTDGSARSFPPCISIDNDCAPRPWMTTPRENSCNGLQSSATPRATTVASDPCQRSSVARTSDVSAPVAPLTCSLPPLARSTCAMAKSSAHCEGSQTAMPAASTTSAMNERQHARARSAVDAWPRRRNESLVRRHRARPRRRAQWKSARERGACPHHTPRRNAAGRSASAAAARRRSPTARCLRSERSSTALPASTNAASPQFAPIQRSASMLATAT